MGYDQKNDYLVITTVAFHEGLRKQFLSQLSYPDNYVERFLYKVRYLKNSDIFNLIRTNNKKILNTTCIYIFTNLHQNHHGYEPLRLCTIKKVVFPEEPYDDEDFIELTIKFGRFINLHKCENTRSKFENYLDNFIKEKEYHYQNKPKFNTYIFSIPKTQIKSFIDFEGKSVNKRWREIITYISNIVKQPDDFYPETMDKKPVVFSNCFFYKWKIYEAESGNLIKLKNDKYILHSNKNYTIKFETYIPKYNEEKYETRKIQITSKDEGPLKPISENKVIFSYSQKADQQFFNFQTKKVLSGTQGIFHIKSYKEENLVYEPDFNIYFRIKPYLPDVLLKVSALIGSLITLIIGIVIAKDLPTYGVVLLLLGSILSLVINSVYSFFDNN